MGGAPTNQARGRYGVAKGGPRICSGPRQRGIESTFNALDFELRGNALSQKGCDSTWNESQKRGRKQVM
jgi:hypothetical protein